MEKIIENKRQRRKRDWQKRVEGRLGAREQWHACVTQKSDSENPSNTFLTPLRFI